jgi:hypothetical protein
MKISRLETHDRLNHFKNDQALNIFQGAEDCLKKNKDSLELQAHFPYIYIFAHPRTAEDGVNKRMLWQPRLTKPAAQLNSYLFRANSHQDLIEIVWLLPPRETWDQYKKGNVCESEEVLYSIFLFDENRSKLEEPHPEDLSEADMKGRLKSIKPLPILS